MDDMEKRVAFVVAGTHSGCGKTTVSLALMAAFEARGFRVQPFKVGPDFIDPGFHAQITGRESRTLDGWMLDRDYNCGLFRDLLARSDMAIVEGVMGLFDGYDGLSEAGSTAEMARWLGLPVILVVDARSMARSAAALIHGFAHFDSHLRLGGVIFNRIGGERHLDYLKEAMQASLPEIPVLGGIPREDAVLIPERHLGLVTSEEVRLDSAHRESMIDLVERYIDADAILERFRYSLVTPSAVDEELPPAPSPSPVIAVARDAAFCFYYPDNLDLLRRAGAELRFFSPLHGESLPRGSSGIYLGGGYPELFAEDLARRGWFLESVRQAALSGVPVYGECGGLMVLSRFIETLDGRRHSMAGLLPFGTRMLKKRKALGYTEVELREKCLLGDPGLRLRGHEFHYSEIVEMEEAHPLNYAYRIRKRQDESARLEGYAAGSVLASYVHLHWGSAPGAAAEFVRRCLELKS